MPSARRAAPTRPAATILAILAVVGLACAAHGNGPGGAHPSAWESPLHRDHPLAGRIWNVRAGAFTDEAALARAAAAAPVVLLGEVHDNLDHHALQARLVRAIAAAGRRPALAFEMVDSDQQPDLDRALAGGGRDPDAVARAVGWDRRGWGPFSRYHPIVAAALESGMPLVGANLPRAEVAAAIHQGIEAIPAAARARIERQPPLTEEARLSLRAEMKASHCGALPDDVLDPMVLAQRAKDAQMAVRLDEVATRDGAILIAGAEHVRTDRGVPSYLDRAARDVLAIAMVEVVPGAEVPGAYAGPAFDAQVLPADFVVFTPAADRDDPCEAFRRHHPPPRPRETGGTVEARR